MNEENSSLLNCTEAGCTSAQVLTVQWCAMLHVVKTTKTNATCNYEEVDFDRRVKPLCVRLQMTILWVFAEPTDNHIIIPEEKKFSMK